VMDSGLPPYNQELVGQVKVTEQTLSALPKHTQLQLAPNTADAIALEIRGSDVEYLFAAP
jgi:predicted metalloenzyme YecM